jgi:hypothetical protein
MIRLLPLSLVFVSAAAFAQIQITAKVEVEDDHGKIALKPPEQLAVMFMTAIQSIEGDCQRHVGEACTMQQMVNGPPAKDKWHVKKLKYDPAIDENYTYTVTTSGQKWEARADPKKPGLGGFLWSAKGFSPDAYYNAKGPASTADRKLTGRSVDGDSFAVQ